MTGIATKSIKGRHFAKKRSLTIIHDSCCGNDHASLLSTLRYWSPNWWSLPGVVSRKSWSRDIARDCWWQMVPSCNIIILDMWGMLPLTHNLKYYITVPDERYSFAYVVLCSQSLVYRCCAYSWVVSFVLWLLYILYNYTFCIAIHLV